MKAIVFALFLAVVMVAVVSALPAPEEAEVPAEFVAEEDLTGADTLWKKYYKYGYHSARYYPRYYPSYYPSYGYRRYGWW